MIHSALLSERPTIYPFLEVTRPDTGEVGWWRGSKHGDALVGQFVDALWGGVDQREVTGFSMVSDTDSDAPAGDTWRIECRSLSHGAVTLMVEVHPAPAAGESIRSAMAGLDLEPGGTPTTFEHLLWNAFLTIVDDVELDLPESVGEALDFDHEVYGPWAPPCPGWTIDEPEASPFMIRFRWYPDSLLADDEDHFEREVWLHLEPETTADEDDAADESGEDDQTDEESSLEYVTVVPFDRATLDAIEARMVAGERPDDAVLAVTGSTRLPDVD